MDIWLIEVMSLFFLKTKQLSRILPICFIITAGCSPNSAHKAEDKTLHRSEERAIQGAGTLNGSAPLDGEQIYVCEKDARIIVEGADLRSAPHGEIVRTLKPGEAVFICGVKADWFIYGYVEAGHPVNCPDIPNIQYHCFVGWSEYELKILIAG